LSKRKFHDGRHDGLVPLESLRLDAVTNFADLLRSMSKTAFTGRQLGEALDILSAMARDSNCHVVMTLSGAMTVAKQGQIVCDLIDRGIVDVVITTGALIAHGLTESIGLTHYRYDPVESDESLYERGYNRIYDTLEMEANLNDVERLVASVLNEESPEDGQWSSERLCRALGGRLSQSNQGTGILRSAFEQDVPVYIPAFTDCEVGLDVATWAMAAAVKDAESRGESVNALPLAQLFSQTPAFNPYLDLYDYARRVTPKESLGILTIGGGVPRNWAQQVGPFIDVVNHRLGTALRMPQFVYGVRICPEPAHWGGLSGCSYSEGVSWGKFRSPAEGGRYAEVFADATAVLPLLVKALFESLDADAQPYMPEK
jgi:deoxyhypusine synthase